MSLRGAPARSNLAERDSRMTAASPELTTLGLLACARVGTRAMRMPGIGERPIPGAQRAAGGVVCGDHHQLAVVTEQAGRTHSAGGRFADGRRPRHSRVH